MSTKSLLPLLLREREISLAGPAARWPFVHEYRGKTLSRGVANQYLLYCQLDFQMPVGTAERNTRRVCEKVLTDPSVMWRDISGMKEQTWLDLAVEHKLHRFASKTGTAVWRVAQRMVRHFDGDARNVLLGSLAGEVQDKLTDSLRIGPQLSRMCVLGLLENGFLSGDGDVKADVHVLRVVGRAVEGTAFTAGETALVQDKLREILPKDKWRLDLPLWSIGRNHCHPTSPDCVQCPIRTACAYARSR